MRKLLSLAFVAGAVLVATPAVAQMNDLTLYRPLAGIPVGSYSKYKVTSPKGQGEMEMTMAVVGKETNGVWMETSMTVPGQGEMAMKMLIGGTGDQQKVEKMIVAMPGRPPMEMPGGAPGAPKIAKPDSTGLVGEETVKVSAGSFKSKHYKKTLKQNDEEIQLDTWVSESVAPMAIVKMTATKKGEKPITVMELVGQGKDAKSKVGAPGAPAKSAPAKK